MGGNYTAKRETEGQDCGLDTAYYLFLYLNLNNWTIRTIIAAGARNKYALANTSLSPKEKAIMIAPKILYVYNIDIIFFLGSLKFRKKI